MPQSNSNTANNPPTSRRCAVVGGGMLGMTCALRLAKAGHAVTLFEASPQLGGLADGWEIGDVCWDRHYHVTLLSDSYLRQILSELGLENELQWTETKTGFFTDGNLYSMSNSLEFLKFPPLSLISKLRLGGTIFLASKLRNWHKLEQVLVEDWLRRWSGKGVCEKIWLPLLRSKLGDNYRRTSAAFIWATIARLYAARRSGLKKELFGYLPGGYARINERFGETLRSLGVAVRLGCPVQSVQRQDGVLNLTAACAREQFELVIATTPSSLIPKIAPQLTEDERAAHAAIQYQGIVCASVLLDEPLSPFYVTNITDPGFPFTGVIEMSALVDRSEFGGKALVYLPHYVAPDDPEFEESDEAIRARYLSALQRMHPSFDPKRVQAFRVSRVKHVMALSTLGYSAKLPPVETSVPGLYALNSAQIVNGTLNVNETIGLAERHVEHIIERTRTLPVCPELSHATT